MKTEISSTLDNAIKKSNINLCATRVQLVLVAALTNGNLDAAIEKFESTISSVIDTFTDEKSE